MKYSYKAKSGVKTVEGTLEGENSTEVIAKLESMGYLPIKIETEEKEKQSSPKTDVKKIHLKELSIFTRQLASMINSKVPMMKSLDILFAESQHAQMKILIGYIRNDVRQGKQLSEAIANYPDYFSKIYVNMIASGEKGGVLGTILLRLVEFSEREEEMRSRIRSALAYPLLMLIVGVLSVFVMLTFVMPKLIKLFEDIEQELPIMTQVLIAISHFSKDNWYWMILGLVIIIVVFKQFKIIEKNRLVIDRWLLRVPILGVSIRKREIARFARTLSLLLENKIPVRDAIGATIPTIGNKALNADLGGTTASLDKGETVSKSFSKGSLFPGFVLSLIAVGEEAGSLDSAFTEIATLYEKELDNEIKVISSLIEPLLILSIGLVIGFIIMAMLMPIFEMNLR